MEHGILHGVHELGWDALEPRVMRPERPEFAHVLETALALTEFETKLVVKRLAETREDRTERAKRRYAAIIDPLELQARSRERARRVEMRRSRALAPADAWGRLVPSDRPPPAPAVERCFAGAVVQKGGSVSSRALRAAWGAWEVASEPTTIDPVLVLASDLEGMRAAEASALEICRHLGRSVKRVTWFIEHEPRLVDFRSGSSFRTRIDQELAIPNERLSSGEIVMSDPPRHPSEDAWRFVWLRLAKRDLVRANVSNDLTPLVDVSRRGYALVDVVDDAVVLAAASPKLEFLFDVLV